MIHHLFSFKCYYTVCLDMCTVSIEFIFMEINYRLYENHNDKSPAKGAQLAFQSLI